MSIVLYPRDSPTLKAWVDHLRATDLPQGSGSLAQLEGGVMHYCCLGVGCVLMGLEPTADGHRLRFDLAALTAPYAFIEWLGFSAGSHLGEWDLSVDWTSGLHLPTTTRRGRLYKDDLDSVAALNDAGFTFAQIADVVEYFGVSAS